MAISTADFKNGMCIINNGKMCTIVEFQHVKPGKGGAFVRTKLKDIKTGRVVDYTFNAGTKFDSVRLESKKMQYLYNDGADYWFMDNSTFEQMPVSADMVGSAADWLKENDEATLLYAGDELISLEPQMFVELEVTHTEPGIKYNPATNTCIKCDLCGGDPMCVKRCPLGASQLSWEEYTVVRPGIDDYVEKSTEGALEGVTFTKEYTGPHAGKAMDEQDWALVPADGGVQVKGQVTSSDGADLRVKMHCDFKDASGNVLGSSEEHMWCMSIHEHLPLEFSFAIDDPSQIAEVVLIGDISYWVKGVDEEY